MGFGREPREERYRTAGHEQDLELLTPRRPHADTCFSLADTPTRPLADTFLPLRLG
jgi:hypothetical protein